MSWEQLVETDSGWKVDEDSSSIRRGITDYYRVIKFSRELIPEEFFSVIRSLRENDCPGYTSILCRVTNGEHRFTTTYDSSD